MTAPTTTRPGGPVFASGQDEERRRDLRRMKTVATGFFVAAVVIYVATVGRDGAWGYVNSAAEAGMVGALADWFAVTAIFRHPLGLPIPHTALVPTRKDILASSLEDFVSSNFLAEANVREKVAAAEVTRRVGVWLGDTAHAERVGQELSTLTATALRVLPDEDVAAVIDEMFIKRIRDLPVAAAGGRLLESIVEDGSHHALVDVAVEEIRSWIEANEETVVDIVADRAPSWTPRWLDERVSRRLHHEVLDFVTDIAQDPDHRVRKAVDDLLRRAAQDLQEDQATRERLDAWLIRMLDHPDVRASIIQSIGTARTLLTDALADADGQLRHRISDGLADLGRRLATDAELQRTVDGHLQDAVGYVVTHYADEVVAIISDTIKAWDGNEASRRIELYVGRDLQFVRINGTVVGALAGLLIHTLTVLFS